MSIQLPFNYSPRSYQARGCRALIPKKDGGLGLKRAVWVWHRRAGKDKTALNFLIDCAAGQQSYTRVGTYYYFYPFANQARKALWEGIGRDGFRYMHHFPGFENPDALDSIVFSKRETDMQITLRDPKDRDKPGSIVQIIGTDNYDSVRSTNPIGIVMSEYADQDPGAWDTMRPILRENGGWAIFVYTPKGANHGKKLYEMAGREPDWFADLLTIEDTHRDAPGEDGSLIITREDYEKEIAEGMDEEFARQEYYCSFSGATVGSYYGRLLQKFEPEIVRDVPWNARYLVHTAWDLGVDDMMAIWFFQLPDGPDGRIHVIEYLEGRNEGLSFYAQEMRTRPYMYGTMLLPHDAEDRDPTEKTSAQHLEGLGFRDVVVLPRGNLVNGIDTTRSILPRCIFDRANTERGRECLKNYRKQLDQKRNTFGQPIKDWASHGADGFRTLAEGLEKVVVVDAPRPTFAENRYTGYEEFDGQRDSSDWSPYESYR